VTTKTGAFNLRAERDGFQNRKTGPPLVNEICVKVKIHTTEAKQSQQEIGRATYDDRGGENTQLTMEDGRYAKALERRHDPQETKNITSQDKRSNQRPDPEEREYDMKTTPPTAERKTMGTHVHGSAREEAGREDIAQIEPARKSSRCDIGKKRQQAYQKRGHRRK